MDENAYKALELNSVLAQLSRHISFSGGQALIDDLIPTPDIEEARYRQQETREARRLLDLKPDVTLGGTRDVRQAALEAERGIMLAAETLLDVKQTFQAGAALQQAITRLEEPLPILAAIAQDIDEGRAVVAAIGRTLDAHGEVMDSASPALATIRRDLRTALQRLQDKLQSIVNSQKNAPYLQEAIVTMRGGRYVIPIKSEHKGRIEGVVHDQSSSGATLFVEPLASLEINNRVRELELAEDEEVRRILAELSALVGEHAPAIVATVGALAALDLAFAKARYANALDASEPELVPFPRKPKEAHPGSTVRLHQARHPLLDSATVVPIDVELDGETYALVITGPNTGGKTVSLKTVGLLALMAQCGLHLPAGEGSALSVFEAIYADIGDEQSIEQSLSTFSGHMSHVIPILERAGARALVILDELGAGTDPGEGSALARAILSALLWRKATTFVATHYPELKAYAHATPGVRNASVQFDLQTLSPTYRLLVGLPGRSNALAIARRLGLPDEILDEARTMVGEADLQLEDLLDEINRTRDEIQQSQERLQQAYSDTQQARDVLHTRLRDIEDERRAVLEAARQETLAELDALRHEVAALRELVQQASEAAETPEVAELEALAEQADALVSSPVELPALEPLAPLPDVPPEAEPEPERDLLPGDRVHVRGLDAVGEIIGLEDGQAEVQLGRMRVRAGLDELTWRPSLQAPARPAGESVRTPQGPSPGLELHLRGEIVEDALIDLDRYLDAAFMAGLPWVRIVHGKGSGKLRSAVRDALAGHPLVSTYEPAPAREGGNGVTIVRFEAE